MLLTRTPLSGEPKPPFPFDLHVLGTPPALILSQDQTLSHNPGHTVFWLSIFVDTTVRLSVSPPLSGLSTRTRSI